MKSVSTPIVLTEINFKKEVLESSGLVLVEFVARWSGSCTLFTSVMNQLKAEFEDQLKLGIVDVDENRNVAAEYAVQSLPTLIFFRQGTVVDHISGVFPRMTIREKICAFLDNPDPT
ncbi:thioredoxin [bacterium]|nr:thioredoxin [bacterium]